MRSEGSGTDASDVGVGLSVDISADVYLRIVWALSWRRGAFRLGVLKRAGETGTVSDGLVVANIFTSA